jgi:hypothetical protein
MLGGSEFDATLLQEERNGARGAYTLRLKYKKLLSPNIFSKNNRKASAFRPFRTCATKRFSTDCAVFDEIYAFSPTHET